LKIRTWEILTAHDNHPPVVDSWAQDYEVFFLYGTYPHFNSELCHYEDVTQHTILCSKKTMGARRLEFMTGRQIRDLREAVRLPNLKSGRQKPMPKVAGLRLEIEPG
jgi:hypothetical protein